MSYVKCKIAFEIAIFFVFQKYLEGGEGKHLSDFKKMVFFCL